MNPGALEMEQLAKMSEPAKSENTYSDTASFDGRRESSMTIASDQIQELKGEELASTHRELELANKTICDLNTELATAKERLTALETRNSANNEVLSIISLQNRPDQSNKIQSDKKRGAGGPSALSNQMPGFSIKKFLARGKESGKAGPALEASSSEGEAPEEYACVSDAESKASAAHTELAASLMKIMRIVEALAQATESAYTLFSSMQTHGISKTLGAGLQGERGQIARSIQWKDPGLENAMRSLVLVGNKLLRGKSDMVDFILELGLTLERIMLRKPFEFPSRGTKCGDPVAAEQHAGGAAARMNLNALKSAPLLPNREIKAGERSPLKEEFPRTWPQFVGAADAGETVYLRTEKDDTQDHLKAGDWAGHSTSENEEIKSRKEREGTKIAAAALADCERTILALGRQLIVMGPVPVAKQEPTETSVGSATDSATSIQKLTENTDFLQWQTQAKVTPCFPDIAKSHNHSPSALYERSSPWVTTVGPHPKGNQSPVIIPGRQWNKQQGSANQSFYGQQCGENSHRFRNDYLDGVGTVPTSPGLSDFSGHGSLSVPASPARSPSSVLLSLRTWTNNGHKSLSEDSVREQTPTQKPRTPSSFSRFYSRSRSGSSGSSS